MARGTAAPTAARCVNCGFEAPADGEAWASVDHPSLGTLTRCPECGSTDTAMIREE